MNRPDKICLLFLFSALISFTQIAVAEENLSDYSRLILPEDNIQPPTPQAASIGEFADFPVTYSSGTVGVNVPLFGWKTGNYPMQLSISWHSGGAKVRQSSSEIGLGWVFDGGGMISREVCGFPDEDTSRELTIPTSKLPFGQAVNALRDKADVHLDRFSYSFPGYSGVFYIEGLRGKGAPVIHDMGFNDLAITIVGRKEGSIGDFVISIPSGETYVFSVRDSVTSEFAPPCYSPGRQGAKRRMNYVTAWHLSEIRLADSPDTIRFSYERMPTSTIRSGKPSEANISYVGPRSNGYGTGRISSDERAISEATYGVTKHGPAALKSITSRTAKVVFTNESAQSTSDLESPYILKAMEVYNHSAKMIRRVEFSNRKDSRSGRLLLNRVTVWADGERIDMRRFSYSTISSVDNGSDIFGFANGLDGRKRNILNGQLTLADNRKPRGKNIVRNVLSEITDIHGVTSYFTFEPRVFRLNDSLSNPSHIGAPPYKFETTLQPDPIINFPDGTKPPGGSLIDALDPIIIPSVQPSVPLDTVIGLRIKSILTTDAAGSRSVKRSFTYENPLCNIDFSSIYAGAFVALSGKLFEDHEAVSGSGSITGKRMRFMSEITGDVCNYIPFEGSDSERKGSERLQLTATLTSSSRMPGFALSDASVNYGRVTETIESTGFPSSEFTDSVTVRTATVYEYDTSTACHSRLVYQADRNINSESRHKSLYFGVDEMYIPDNPNCAIGLFTAKPVDGYFRECVGASPLLVRKTSCRIIGGELKPFKSQHYGYRKNRECEITVGHHLESTIAATWQNGAMYENYTYDADIHRFPVNVQAISWVCDTVSSTEYSYKTSTIASRAISRTISMVTERYSSEQLSECNHIDEMLHPGNKGKTPHRIFGDSARMATRLNLPRRVVVSCGNDSVERLYLWAANMNPTTFVGKYLAAGRPGAPVAEAFISKGDTVVTTTAYASFGLGVAGNLILPSSVTAAYSGHPAATKIAYLSYDRLGHPTKVRQGNAPAHIYKWDNYDNLLATGIDGMPNLETTCTYTPLVGCTSITQPSGKISSFAYHAGRLAAEFNTTGDTIASWSYALCLGNDDSYGVNSIIATTHGSSGGRAPRRTLTIYDGFGQPTHSLAYGAGGNGENLLNVIDRDGTGREIRQWLPVPFDDDDPSLFRDVDATAYYGEKSRPFTETNHHNESTERQISTISPGADMAKHPAKRTLSLNPSPDEAVFITEYNCTAWRFDLQPGGSVIKKNGQWPRGTLSAESVMDADGRETITFTNYRGQTVLKRRIAELGRRIDTYFIYDPSGNLVAVLPPEFGAASLDSIDMDSNTDFQNLCYRYTYDHRMLMVSKKLPGCEPVHYIYDDSRRLVATTTGTMRHANNAHVTIRDKAGRTVIEAMVSLSSLDKIREQTPTAEFNPNYGNRLNGGYDIFPDVYNNMRILKVYYYDNYDFLDLPQFSSILEKTYGEHSGLQPYGLQTGYISANLRSRGEFISGKGLVAEPYGGNDDIRSCIFYDEEMRPVRSITCGQDGSIRTDESSYNIDGSLINIQQYLSSAHDHEIGEFRSFDYDLSGRTVTESAFFNYRQGNYSPRPVTINFNKKYDATGFLTEFRPGNMSPVTYSYDTAGRLRGITSDYFSQTLRYADGRNPQYGGNISEITWLASTDNISRTYKFTYDALDRLTAANYSASESSPDYSCKYTYSDNSSLLSVKRNGPTDASGNSDIVDDLTFTYDGNKLISIKERASEVILEGSFDLQNDSRNLERTYDCDGRLTSDPWRRIRNICYNEIGLPCKIDSEDGIIYITYDADGNKLSETVYDRMELAFTGTIPLPDDGKVLNYVFKQAVSYVGNSRFVLYRKDGNWTFSHYAIPEGYYVPADFNCHYRDYQGNVRSTVGPSGYIGAVTHYYPYGLPMAESRDFETRVDRRRHCDKEFITDFSINTYDYTARPYAPAAVAFDTPDPCAELNYDKSIYSFCSGNPINRIDPLGLTDYFVTGTNTRHHVDDGNHVVYEVNQEQFDALTEIEFDTESELYKSIISEAIERNDLFPTIDDVLEGTDHVGWTKGSNCRDLAYEHNEPDPKGSNDRMDSYNPSNKSHLQPLDECVDYIQTELKKGHSLVAGVHYNSKDESKNHNKSTYHFVNIVGMGFKMENNQPVNYFRYHDHARKDINLNRSPLNIFTLGQYKGEVVYRAEVGDRGVRDKDGRRVTYILSEIRVNP